MKKATHYLYKTAYLLILFIGVNTVHSQITAPTAGQDGILLLCSSICSPFAEPIDLFSIITGEDAGGTWTITSGTGGIFDAEAGTFTPITGSTTSVFTYTIGNDTSTATIVIVPIYNVGQNIIICETNTDIIQLSDLLTGENPGGTWSRITGFGGVFDADNGTFFAAIGATTSMFSYTIASDSPCGNSTTVVTISINPAANAGEDGAITVCSASFNMMPIDLSGIISNESDGGIWTRTSGTGGVFNSSAGYYIPSPNSTDSTFLYTIYVVAPCANDTSTAAINIVNAGNAGTVAEIIICSDETATIQLATLISGETAGGIWTRLTGTGGIFVSNAGTFTPTSGTTSSTFNYTFNGACGNDSSTVTITILPAADAGQSGEISICSDNFTTIYLSDIITGETINGSWTIISGTGGIFDPVAGTYTPTAGATSATFAYSINENCGTSTSTATIFIINTPNAGTSSTITTCASAIDAINLFDVISGESSGGIWELISGSGGIFDAASGSFLPLAIGNYIFTYTVINDCGVAVSTTTVNVISGAYAGESGSLAVCSNTTTTIFLADIITGAPQGGTWSQSSGFGGIFNASEGTFTPTSGVTTSTFIYTISGDGNCGIATSTATVTITTQPTAVITYSGPFCITSSGSQLVSLTGTGIFTGGVFSSSDGLSIDEATGVINVEASLPGNYLVSYALAAAEGCLSVTATTQVVVETCDGNGDDEGCSHGYWKNHTDRWCDAYTPTMLFGSVFTNAPAQLSGLTLLQVLNQGGGGIYNLGRQGVAALLNACSDEVSFPEPYGNDPQSVINAVNMAYASGGNAPGVLATELDILNNLGCPLGETPAVNKNQFQVYPVLFKENITIRSQFDFETDVLIQFYDTNGRLLQQVDYTTVNFGEEITIDLNFSHASGQIFLVKVVTNKGFSTKKIISDN